MVEDLHSADPSRADATAIHGVERIPGNPDQPAVHDAALNAAAGRAEETGGSETIFEARCPARLGELLRRPLDPLSLQKRPRRRDRPRGPQKLPPGLGHARGLPAIDDMRCNRATALWPDGSRHR